MDQKQKRIEEKIQELLSEDQSAVLKAILENLRWPKNVDSNTEYFIREDDCSGARSGISFHFLSNGDAILDLNECKIKSEFAESEIYSEPHIFRFRTDSGGGKKPLIQKALLILAMTVANNPDEINKIE